MRRLSRVLSVLLALIMLLSVTSAFAATENLVITQIVQNESHVKIYAQRINSETKTVSEAVPAAEQVSVSLNSGSEIQAAETKVFSDADEGTAYTIVVDINNRLYYNDTIKSLQELCNSFGDKDYVKIIYAGENATSAFEEGNGYTQDMSRVKAEIEKLKEIRNGKKPALLDGLKLAMDSSRSKPVGFPDRQVIILFTMGKDADNGKAAYTTRIGELTEEAGKLGVPIYVVGIDGSDKGVHADVSDYGAIVRASGGQLFETESHKVSPIDSTKNLVEILKGTYLIEFDLPQDSFGVPNVEWVLYINDENGTISSGDYTFSLRGLTAPAPVEDVADAVPVDDTDDAGLEAFADDTSDDPIDETADETVDGTVQAEAETEKNGILDKVLEFVKSPVGLILMGVLLLIIVLIIVVIARGARRRKVIIEEDDDDDDTDSGDAANIYIPDDPYPSMGDGMTETVEPGTYTPPTPVPAGIPVHLAMKLGDRVAETTLRVSDPVFIGRIEGNQVRIPDEAISKRHCALESANGVLCVRDCGSSNGTFLNGQKVTAPAPLKNGDQLRLGNTVIRIDILG